MIMAGTHKTSKLKVDPPGNEKSKYESKKVWKQEIKKVRKQESKKARK